MRIASPSRLMSVARTDKEARLREFIAEGFASAAEQSAVREPVTILAHNLESPVARALLSVLNESWPQANGIRVIIGETSTDAATTNSLLDLDGEFRVLNSSRFGAAHEQLVISSTRFWVGDCLRRDPSKKDAFEVYHGNDANGCVLAIASFEKLWAAATPIKRIKAETLSPEIIAAGHSEAIAPPTNVQR